VKSATLERPTAGRVGANGRQRQVLHSLVARLEVWLPAEEARLSRARQRHLPEPTREAEWRMFLGLYERLCVALAGSAQSHAGQ